MEAALIAAAVFGAAVASAGWLGVPVLHAYYKNWKRRQKRRAKVKKDGSLLGS